MSYNSGQYFYTKRKKENSKFIKAINLKKRYGITLEKYNEILKQQQGHCALCANTKSIKGNKIVDLSVDHCHDSNIIRGLLCYNCNAALGFIKDDLNWLSKAIEYLKKTNG